MGAVRAASPARRCPIPHGCDRQKCRLRQAQPTPSPPPVALPSGAPVYPSDSFPFLMITTICSIAASPKLRDLGSFGGRPGVGGVANRLVIGIQCWAKKDDSREAADNGGGLASFGKSERSPQNLLLTV